MSPGRRYDIVSWGVTLGVTAALVASWIALVARHAAGPVSQIDRKTIVPLEAVDAIGIGAVLIAVVAITLATWRRTSPVLVQETAAAIRAEKARRAEAGERLDLTPAVRAAAREIAGGGMADCEDFQQWFAHLLVMWGFVGLGVTTTLDFFVNRAGDPLPILHPVRVLGNATGVLFMAGLTLAIARRALLDRVRARSTGRDWGFLLALWATGATGFAVQWFADGGHASRTAAAYVVHLVFIALILATAPWTKFLHAVWRPSWALYRAVTALRRS